MVTHGDGLKFHVAPDGNDAWSGKQPRPRDGDGPFATLEGARDALRAVKKAEGLPPGGATVEIRAGTYELGRPFELAAEDSGADDAPIVYRARPGHEVRLVGGRLVTNFEPVTDAMILGRLDEAARAHVLQADLGALGITDFGELAEGKRLELFFDDKPMTLARWPNEGFVTIVDVAEKDGHEIHGDLTQWR